MKKVVVKAVSLLLASLLTAASFAGCAKSSAPPEDAKSAPAASASAALQPNAPVYPLKTDATLTFWMKMNANWSGYAQNFSDLPIAQEITKRTGVKIEYIHPPLGQETDVFNLMIASGDYPDMVEYAWAGFPGGPNAAINNAVIIKLNEVLDKYSPNLKKFLADHPEYNKEAKMDDGTYYFYPFVRDGKELLNSAGPIIRKDWLTELGIALPETVDDWYNLLKAFKEKKGATAPLTVTSDKKNTQAFSIFEGAYNIYTSPSSFYIKDNKVQYALMQPSYKEQLTMLVKLYQEGLLDKNFATTDAKTRDSNMLNNKSGATFGTGAGNMGSWITTMKDKDPRFDLTPAKFPVLKKGDSVTVGYASRNMEKSTQIAITTKCKNVEAAARFLDYGYSQEGHLLYNFGIEGKSYTMVNGIPTYTDEVMKNPDKLTIAQALSKYARSSTAGPFVQDVQYLMQYYTMPQQKEALKLWSDNDKPNSMAPMMTSTDVESAEAAKIMNDVSTYASEMLFKFLLGQVPLTDFDKYVDQLKKLNVERAISLQQQALDRFNKR